MSNMPLSQLKPITSRRKQAQAIEALTALAHEVGPGKKLPTVVELTSALKITVATLNQCLAVLEQRHIITRSQGSGIYVSPRIRHKHIGLIFGHDIFSPSASPVFLRMLQYCQRRATNCDTSFSVYIDLAADANGINMHGDLAEALDNKKLHGMLLFARCSDQQEEWLKSYGVPLVIYSEWGNHDWKVMTDYEVFSRQAVELLHQQGCRKIGMISLGVNHHSFFLNALKEFNLKAYPQWIVSAPSGKTAGNQEHFGRVEALRIIDHMNKNGRPDGIVISDDVMAVGACQAFEEKGFTPGKSIGFVTLSNKGSWSLREWHDKISRIEFNPSDYVDSAFYLLDLLMAGQKLERRIIKIRPEAIYPVEPTLTP